MQYAIDEREGALHAAQVYQGYAAEYAKDADEYRERWWNGLESNWSYWKVLSHNAAMYAAMARQLLFAIS